MSTSRQERMSQSNEDGGEDMPLYPVEAVYTQEHQEQNSEKKHNVVSRSKAKQPTGTKKAIDYFNISSLGLGNKFGICSLCKYDNGAEEKPVIIKMKNSNTTGLIRHLRNKHAQVYHSIYSPEPVDQEISISSMQDNSQMHIDDVVDLFVNKKPHQRGNNATTRTEDAEEDSFVVLKCEDVSASMPNRRPEEQGKVLPKRARLVRTCRTKQSASSSVYHNLAEKYNEIGRIKIQLANQRLTFMKREHEAKMKLLNLKLQMKKAELAALERENRM